MSWDSSGKYLRLTDLEVLPGRYPVIGAPVALADAGEESLAGSILLNPKEKENRSNKLFSIPSSPRKWSSDTSRSSSARSSLQLYSAAFQEDSDDTMEGCENMNIIQPQPQQVAPPKSEKTGTRNSQSAVITLSPGSAGSGGSGGSPGSVGKPPMAAKGMSKTNKKEEEKEKKRKKKEEERLKKEMKKVEDRLRKAQLKEKEKEKPDREGSKKEEEVQEVQEETAHVMVSSPKTTSGQSSAFPEAITMPPAVNPSFSPPLSKDAEATRSVFTRLLMEGMLGGDVTPQKAVLERRIHARSHSALSVDVALSPESHSTTTLLTAPAAMDHDPFALAPSLPPRFQETVSAMHLRSQRIEAKMQQLQQEQAQVHRSLNFAQQFQQFVLGSMNANPVHVIVSFLAWYTPEDANGLATLQESLASCLHFVSALPPALVLASSPQSAVHSSDNGATPQFRLLMTPNRRRAEITTTAAPSQGQTPKARARRPVTAAIPTSALQSIGGAARLSQLREAGAPLLDQEARDAQDSILQEARQWFLQFLVEALNPARFVVAFRQVNLGAADNIYELLGLIRDWIKPMGNVAEMKPIRQRIQEIVALTTST
jgi:hypothetical protein